MWHLLHKHQKAKTTSHRAPTFCNLVLTSSAQHLLQTDSYCLVFDLLRKKPKFDVILLDKGVPEATYPNRAALQFNTKACTDF